MVSKIVKNKIIYAAIIFFFLFITIIIVSVSYGQAGITIGFGFLGSILGGGIGGVLTYLGVLLTIKHTSESLKIQEKQRYIEQLPNRVIHIDNMLTELGEFKGVLFKIQCHPNYHIAALDEEMPSPREQDEAPAKAKSISDGILENLEKLRPKLAHGSAYLDSNIYPKVRTFYNEIFQEAHEVRSADLFIERVSAKDYARKVIDLVQNTENRTDKLVRDLQDQLAVYTSLYSEQGQAIISIKEEHEKTSYIINKQNNETNMLLTLMELINFPMYFILINVIYNEKISSSKDMDKVSYFYNLIDSELGIECLLKNEILIGSKDSFRINENYNSFLSVWLNENRKIINELMHMNKFSMNNFAIGENVLGSEMQRIARTLKFKKDV